MSDLQRKWAKSRAPLDGSMMPPPRFLGNDLDAGTGTATGTGTETALPELMEVDDDGGESGTVPELPEFADDDSSSASSASSTGTVVPSPRQNLFARPQGVARGRTLEVIPWTTYFERELFLPTSDGVTFHAYLTSPVGSKGPLFVMHHGGGSSGLSFAVVASEIRKRLPTAGILSLDARGHGLTTVTGPPSGGAASEQPLDLSLNTLSADLYAVILATKDAMKWPALPPMVLVGHSLGGAVVTDLAKSFKLGDSVLGFAVLDVVEGSAMDALKSMQTYLATRPMGFASVQAAVDWHIRSRTIRNSVSARTSVPALLVRDESGDSRGGGGAASEEQSAAGSSSGGAGADTGTGTGTGTGTVGSRPWKWRTDLAATQPFWADWFVGLSKKFLSARGGKLLLLAGTDRLDTELTIGQMQGKYALQVFPEAGHFIHEDLPERTAVSLVDFHRRNDRTALVLPPKVSDLLAQGKKV